MSPRARAQNPYAWGIDLRLKLQGHLNRAENLYSGRLHREHLRPTPTDISFPPVRPTQEIALRIFGQDLSNSPSFSPLRWLLTPMQRGGVGYYELPDPHGTRKTKLSKSMQTVNGNHLNDAEQVPTGVL